MSTYEQQMKERIVKTIESISDKDWEGAVYGKEGMLMNENIDNFYRTYEDYRVKDGHLGVWGDVEDFVLSTIGA